MTAKPDIRSGRDRIVFITKLRGRGLVFARRHALPAFVILTVAAFIPRLDADIPAGGALATPGLGIGSGTPTTWMAPTPAASAAVRVNSAATTAGWIDLPNLTLRTTGDWAIFIATTAPSGDHDLGTILSIGTPSNTLFRDPGHLTLNWCGRYTNPWSNALYPKSFVVTGRDDAGTHVSTRDTNAGGGSSVKFFGMQIDDAVHPLVSFGGMADNKACGIVIQRRGGTVELWAVDGTGPRLMDYGSVDQTFTGITNKPFRIGAAHMITQPTVPTNYWKKSMQGLVVYNGGTLTPIQMQRLFNGDNAQTLLNLQASRDDRYYPGTLNGSGLLTELVANKHGTPTGAVIATTAILPTGVTDDVIVDMDGGGQVLPKDPPPATTSKARFWGTRIGATADIRMRIVTAGAANPPPSGEVIVDWVTVATGVQNSQTWIGEIPGVPHAFANYDCEISWRVGSGSWTPGKRLNRRWSMGIPIGLAGQSIIQKHRSNGGASRTFNSTVAGFMRAYYDIAQNSVNNMDHRQTQGWLSRPSSTGAQWGENRMSERLALLTGAPVGIGNFAVGGSPISGYLGESKERWIRWKRFIQRNRPQIGIWGNGQGDLGMSRAQRYAALDSLLAQYHEAVQTAPGGPWNYQFYVFPLNGNWGSNNPDSMRSYDIEWVRSRAAQGKPVSLLCTVLDETTADGIHITANDPGEGLFAGRMAQSVAQGVGLAAYSGNGPEINRAASSWSTAGGITTVNLQVIPNGGTALMTAGGGTPSGFKVKLDSGSYVVPASAQIVSPTQIVLTANGTATSSVSVIYLSGGPGTLGGGAATTKVQAGTNNAIYDNRGDLTGLVPGYPMPPLPGADPLVMLPGAGTLLEDSFTDGNATGWTTAHPSQWSVLADGGDNGYKFDFTWANQSSTSVAGNVAWTNYSFYAAFKITDMPSWSDTYLFVRYADSGNYYRLLIPDKGGYRQFQLQKAVGGVVSNVGAAVNVSLAANIWHDVTLDVNGSTLTVFLNGSQVMQRTDGSIPAGKIGFGARKQDVLFDNVLVQ